MVAGHLAAGMAIKGRVPEAPTWALLVGAMFLDVLNPVLASAGFDRATVTEWSHSMVLSAVWSTIFGALFLVRGWTVAVSIAVAVLSHFLLDVIVNSGFALWPGSSVHLGLGLSRTLPTGWWVVELTVVATGVLYYWYCDRKLHRVRPTTWALGALVFTLHFMTSPWLHAG